MTLFDEQETNNIAIEIRVPAVPVAQPRQRHRTVKTNDGKSFVQNYTPAKHPVQDFKATVRRSFEDEYTGPPLTGPLRCDVTCVFPRPKNRIWKTRPMPREFHDKKPDRDNLDKAVMDALKSLAWVDDAQVCQGEIKKFVAAGDEQPHAVIRITQLTQGEN